MGVMLRAGDRRPFSVRLGRIWQLGAARIEKREPGIAAFEGDFAGGQRTKLLSATTRRAGRAPSWIGGE
jgi:hypothetical protein